MAIVIPKSYGQSHKIKWKHNHIHVCEPTDAVANVTTQNINLTLFLVFVATFFQVEPGAGPSSLFIFSDTNFIRRFTLFLIEWPPFEYTILLTIIGKKMLFVKGVQMSYQ